jgi:hypothetical protein
MTSTPTAASAASAKPQPNVYTALLLVAALALLATLVMVLWTLLSPMPNGFGMKIGDLF